MWQSPTRPGSAYRPGEGAEHVECFISAASRLLFAGPLAFAALQHCITASLQHAAVRAARAKGAEGDCETGGLVHSADPGSLRAREQGKGEHKGALRGRSRADETGAVSGEFELGLWSCAF